MKNVMKYILIVLSVFCTRFLFAIGAQDNVLPDFINITIPRDSIVKQSGGYMSTLTGKLCVLHTPDNGPYSGSPREIAEQFLRDYANILGMDASLNDLLFTLSIEMAEYTLRFAQVVDGIKVYGSEIVISVDHSAGKVTQYGGNYYPDLEIDRGVSYIDSTNALAIAEGFLIANGVAREDIHHEVGCPSIEKNVIFQGQGKKGLVVYNIFFALKLESVGNYRMLIDARSGEVLSGYDVTIRSG